SGVGVIAACSASSGGGEPNPVSSQGGTSGFGGGQYGGVPVGGANGSGGSGPIFGGGNTAFDASIFNTGGFSAGGASTGGGGPLPPPPPPQNTPVVIDECPGSLDPALAQSLQQGGSGGTSMLYPYDGTVFPVGLIPP